MHDLIHYGARKDGLRVHRPDHQHQYEQEWVNDCSLTLLHIFSVYG